MGDLGMMSVPEMDDWIGAASTPDLEANRLSTCYNEIARRFHQAVDEITRLRTELAEVRADLVVAQSQAGRWEKLTEAFSIAERNASTERDTLRQQLAVAREGLETIAFEAGHALTDFKRNALLRIEEIAREYLAKMEKA